MSGDSNKALVRRFFDEVCNGRNPGVAHEIFAADFVYHEPASISPGGKGPDAMAREAANYYNAMSNAQWVVQDVLAGEDNAVTVRWTGQGTHDGNLAGIPPTGKEISVEALSLFKVADGKIVEMWDCWDALAMLQQLGIVPRMG
ncbi:MAG TPA: ester cyclase [Kouleothrix sp.]|nr:ester cyclase [Kouleothrix sp.]